MQALFQEGWSKRKIAAQPGISRNTLDRYLQLGDAQTTQAGSHRSKLEQCLEWLEQQKEGSIGDSKDLQQRLKEEKENRTNSGVGIGKNRMRPLNHQLGDVKLKELSMSRRRRLIRCLATGKASPLHGDGLSRPALGTPTHRGPVAGGYCRP